MCEEIHFVCRHWSDFPQSSRLLIGLWKMAYRMKKRCYPRSAEERQKTLSSRYRTKTRRREKKRLEVNRRFRLPTMFGYTISEHGKVNGRWYEVRKTIICDKFKYGTCLSFPTMPIIAREVYDRRQWKVRSPNVFVVTARNEWWIL